MPPPASLIAVAPLGPISAAAVLWRMRGQRYVTAIIKATFALVPERRMTLLEPDPIAFDEQPDPAGHGLRSAGDLAPYLHQTDVWVTGHAEITPRFSEPRLHLWLAVMQGGQTRIDKWIDLSRTEEAQGHVHIDGLGPLSAAWPQRGRFLGALDPRRLRGPVLDIPDWLDWTYFQEAPPDQRMDPLLPDAWLVLGGMIARLPRLRTELPELHAVAHLYRRDQAPPRTGEPLTLRADMLQVDVDRLCCSIVWRGHTAIGDADPASLCIVAGLARPEQPVVWADPFENAEAAEPPPKSPLQRTLMLDDETAARLAAIQPTPFTRPQAPSKETMTLDLETFEPVGPATPFERPAPSAEIAAPAMPASERTARPPGLGADFLAAMDAAGAIDQEPSARSSS